MKIVFAGTPANAARTLEALLQTNHEVVAVLTRPDAPVGRKRVVTPSPVAHLAQQHGLKIFKANRIDQELASQLAVTGAQIGVVVAYGALLKKFALDALPMGWVNLHYSLLPDWRGAAPVQNSILAGDTRTGVTLFQLDEGMDTGPILDVVLTEIQVGETSGRLLSRLTELGITLLAQALPALEAGFAQAIAQTGSGTMRPANKLERSQAKVDWNLNSTLIERQILAMNPEPMAYSVLGNETFRIIDAASLGKTDWSSLGSESQEDHNPGSIRFEARRVLVECGAGTLLQLKTVQPAGKNPMPATDWARGGAAKFSCFDPTDPQSEGA